ncbi:MAG: hypothetical protein WDW38_009919 [Sanguina aurantia]
MSGRVIADPATAAVHVAGKEGITSYHADRVFPAEVTQEEIYEGLGAEIVEFSCLGKSVMVFAYGQTGSGKTHTILGDMRIAGGEQRGLVPRMVMDLFTSLEEKASSQLPDMQRVHLVMTYLEIYNDTLKDLIANSAEDLAVRQVDSVFKVMGLREERAFTGGGPPGEGLRILRGTRPPRGGPPGPPCRAGAVGPHRVEARSVESALRVLEAASARRRVAMTATNSQSSRSHSVLTLAMPSAGSSVTLVDLAARCPFRRSMWFGTPTAPNDPLRGLPQADSRVRRGPPARVRHVCTLGLIDGCLIEPGGVSHWWAWQWVSMRRAAHRRISASIIVARHNHLRDWMGTVDVHTSGGCAGSEQYTSTDVQRAEEGTHVKKSLMNLGKIIRALAERRQPGVCIPGMRDSTLVKILMASADSDCFARARTHRGASSPPSCSLAQPG